MKRRSLRLFWIILTASALLYPVYKFAFPKKPEGCYIKTGLMTQLLAKPDLFSPHITTLPQHKIYPVLSVKVVKHVKDHYLLFVEDKKLGVRGWIKTFGLDYVDSSCYR